MRKIILIIIVILLFLSAGIAGALYIIGDRVISSIIASEEAAPNEESFVGEEADVREEKVMEKEAASGSDVHDTATKVTAKPGSNENAHSTNSLIGQDSPIKSDTGTKSGQATNRENKTQQLIKQAEMQTPEETPVELPEAKPPNETPKSTISVSASELKQVEKQVTAADKVNAASIVLKKLTPAEINELKGMLAGGVTASEKKKAKEIVYSRFTQKEIEEIKEIYYKYMEK